MSLTRKQTAKVAAALCLIRDAGYDLGTVTAEANARQRNGTPAQRAYQDSLNRFVERTPSMLAPLQRATNLVEASSIATVARYNVALRKYAETGDDSSLRSLASMIVQDMTDLAAHNGETAPEFSPEVDAIMSGDAPEATPTVAEGQPVPATFTFAALGNSEGNGP